MTEPLGEHYYNRDEWEDVRAERAGGANVPPMLWRWCDEHLAAHGPDTPVFTGCNLSDEEFDSREEAEAFGLSVAD